MIFDAVGGQAVEDDARLAFQGGKGHFVTIIGPGEATFGEGTDGGFKNIANGLSISARFCVKIALLPSLTLFNLTVLTSTRRVAFALETVSEQENHIDRILRL